MGDQAHTLILYILREESDPKMQAKASYKLYDIFVITVCSIITRLERSVQMEDLGKNKFG